MIWTAVRTQYQSVPTAVFLRPFRLHPKKCDKSQKMSLKIKQFHVNEDWLRTGNGDMFIEMTKDEQIEEFIGDALRNEEDSFKKRLISGLAALDENGWKVLEDFLDSIQKKERD